jgi:hypothetical protein
MAMRPTMMAADVLASIFLALDRTNSDFFVTFAEPQPIDGFLTNW